MPAVLARALLVAVALPSLLPAPAHADILSGCFGAVVVVCHPRVSSKPVGLGSVPIEVCDEDGSSCRVLDVPAPVLTGDDLCVSWTDENGVPGGQCTGIRI